MENHKEQILSSVKGIFHSSETFQAYNQLFDDYVNLARFTQEKEAHHQDIRAFKKACTEIQKLLLRIIANKKVIGEDYESEKKELSLLSLNYNVIM